MTLESRRPAALPPSSKCSRKGHIIFFFTRRGDCKICGGRGGSHFFFAALRGGGGHIFLVLTKSYKRVCTTHLQHVTEYHSGLL